MKNIPQIRFKGFSGEWEEKKTIEIAPLQRGFDLPIEQIKEGKYPVVFSNGILKTHSKYKVNAPGVVTGRSGTIGNITYVTDNFWPHNTSLWVTNFKGNDSKFIYYFYLNFKLDKYATGSGVPTLNRNDVHNVGKFIPSAKEQTKIGDYFQRLDKLIEQKEQKYQKLLQLKKAMLGKMFPKNGAATPEIRFKGFDGEWEEKRLGELATFSKGQGYSKNDLIETGTPIILYGRLYTKYQITISEVDTFVKQKESSIISKGNEVIVPASGETAEDIARASAIKKSGFLIGGDLNIVYPNNEIDNIFLALSISNGEAQKDLSKKAQGKSVVHLRNNDLKEIDLLYPTLAEQTKIGDYFQKLDKLIDLSRKELEKLKNIKKASLDKMFV